MDPTAPAAQVTSAHCPAPVTEAVPHELQEVSAKSHTDTAVPVSL